MSEPKQRLQSNLSRVLDRIAAAAKRSGRSPGSVRLIAVTKYVDADMIRDLFDAGCEELGESRPQVLWDKALALADTSIRWHQIGHLQRNKLKRTLPYVELVHSVDSERLLGAIDEIQLKADHGPKKILLEVNVSGDDAKHGFSVEDLPRAIELAESAKGVQLQGLMCMAGFGTNPEEARRDFAKLREIRDAMAERYVDADLSELSMGMSGDFEQAIEEGATLVRVGSALFEGLR